MGKLLLFVVIFVAVGGRVFAQDDDGRAPVDALLWGADYFVYPEWDVFLTASDGQISVTWNRDGDPRAVVYFSQVAWDEAYIGEELSKFVDVDWLTSSLENYDSWEEQARCLAKSILTIELEMQFDGQTYESRYWIYSEEDTFVSVFAGFVPEETDQLNDVGEHFFAENASCEHATN